MIIAHAPRFLNPRGGIFDECLYFVHKVAGQKAAKKPGADGKRAGRGA